MPKSRDAFLERLCSCAIITPTSASSQVILWGRHAFRGGAAVKRPRLEDGEELLQSCRAGFVQFFCPQLELQAAIFSIHDRQPQYQTTCSTSPFTSHIVAPHFTAALFGLLCTRPCRAGLWFSCFWWTPNLDAKRLEALRFQWSWCSGPAGVRQHL